MFSAMEKDHLRTSWEKKKKSVAEGDDFRDTLAGEIKDIDDMSVAENVRVSESENISRIYTLLRQTQLIDNWLFLSPKLFSDWICGFLRLIFFFFSTTET